MGSPNVETDDRATAARNFAARSADSSEAERFGTSADEYGPSPEARLNDIAASLSPLQSTGRVLAAQLDSVVDFTDGAAHELVSRLSAISREMHGVVETVTKAWKTDSAAFMAEVQRTTRERKEALLSLRTFMSQREVAVEAEGARWRTLLTEADGMHGNVEDIRQLAQTAKILTINARIEAARAGENGHAFDIIASEMRKLTEGVDEIAKVVGDRVDSMGTTIRSSHLAETERAIVAERETVEELARRLDQLGAFDALQRSTAQLLAQLAGTTESISSQVHEALASVQFQDISRQKIEQVNKALESLGGHLAQVVEFASSSTNSLDPTALDTSAMLSQYVMKSQRDIHVRITGDGERENEPTDDSEPAIELF